MAKKILVVDDDDGILEALEVMLTTSGYEVQLSRTGEELFTNGKNKLPDLVLMDVLLSGLDGRELCREAKSRPNTKNIPIIMLSAAPDTGVQVRGTPADDYLQKPFEMNDLLAKIAKYI